MSSLRPPPPTPRWTGPVSTPGSSRTSPVHPDSPSTAVPRTPTSMNRRHHMAQSLDGTQVPIVSSRVNPIHLAVNMDTRLLRGLLVFPLLSIMAMFGKTTSGFSMPSFPLSLNMKRGERGGGGGREGEEGEKGGKEDEWATPAWKRTTINSLADRGHLQLDIVYVSYVHTIPIQFILLQHPCSITAIFIPISARSSLYGLLFSRYAISVVFTGKR